MSKSLGEVKFQCPNCGKSEIKRTKRMRELASKYICHSCNFEGPN